MGDIVLKFVESEFSHIITKHHKLSKLLPLPIYEKKQALDACDDAGIYFGVTDRTGFLLRELMRAPTPL